MTTSQDNIDKLIKLVHLEAEGAHQSIRRARTKGMDTIKKAFKGASQDEKKRQEKEVGVVLVYTVSMAAVEGGVSGCRLPPAAQTSVLPQQTCEGLKRWCAKRLSGGFF